jgi:DNA-binding PadR family transcriptional regulator
MTRERRSSPQTLALLAAFLERPRAWRHGYDLSTETELQSGTIYPVLMRLCERGLLDAKWQPSEIAGRPPRRMYRLTGDGLVFARDELSAAEKRVHAPHPAGGRA